MVKNMPNGATELLIHQLIKAVREKKNALTEAIDDAIDAVKDSPNAEIHVLYDPDTRILKVSDFGFGCGMDEEELNSIMDNFYSHNFKVSSLSKFGLGRFYPFVMFGDYPNMTYRTSTGNGIMHEASCSVPNVKSENWIFSKNTKPCAIGVHGTEVSYCDVTISESEIEEIIQFCSTHYAETKCKIIFNGKPLTKYNPCHLEKLPNGINSDDGIYVKDGFVHYVSTETCSDGTRTVKLRFFALSITKRAFGLLGAGSNCALNGGVYTCLGSNILNKGDNGTSFLDRVLTRGGSGSARLLVQILEDDDNALELNDVKSLGYAPFFMRRDELNKFKNSKGQKLYDDLIAETFKKCIGLYNKIGQNKHNYNDEELFKIVSETYHPTKKEVKTRKVCSSVIKASKDKHVEFIEKSYKYVSLANEDGAISVSIKNKDNVLHIDVNPAFLPSNWSSITKEDLLISFTDFLIEMGVDPNIIKNFSKNFNTYIKRYDAK